MSPRHFVKSALSVSVATTVSRIFGYIRDVSMAIVLGAGFGMDAFTIAYRIANLFRRIVGEGSMSACFVPVFVHYQKDHPPEEQWDFARKFLYTLLLITTLLTVLVIVFSPFLIQVMAPGFAKVAGKEAATIFLNRLMAPYLIFIGLSALFMSILNTFKIFFLPSTTPIYQNLSIIAAAVFLAPLFKEPAVAVAIGVMFGGFLQWAVLVPSLKKLGMTFRPTLRLYHPETLRIGKLLLPMIFGIGIVQINLLIDSIFGSFLTQGSVSSLYYSDRVMELVLGIFAVSLATVILPELSHAAKDQDHSRGSSVLTMSLRLILFVSLPATIGLMVLNQEIVYTLFRYGHFTVQDAERTASALFFFAFGLSFISAAKVVIPAFYAFKDTRTPVIGSFLALISNLILILVLIKPLQVGGIALATSLASLINLGFLLWKLEKKYFKIEYGKILDSLKKISVASIAMAAAAKGIMLLAGFQKDAHAFQKAWPLALAVTGGLAIYLLVCYLMKTAETKELVRLFKNRKSLVPPSETTSD